MILSEWLKMLRRGQAMRHAGIVRPGSPEIAVSGKPDGLGAARAARQSGVSLMVRFTLCETLFPPESR
jgi:hypothetical protein